MVATWRLREPNQHGAKPGDQRDHAGNLVAEIEPHVERDLIVARTPGVELAPGLSNQRDQPALDRQVDVFIGDIELEASIRDFTFDTLESADDCTQLARLEQSSLRRASAHARSTREYRAEKAADRRATTR